MFALDSSSPSFDLIQVTAEMCSSRVFIWNYEEYDFFDNTVKRFASKFGVEFSEDEPGCMVITKLARKWFGKFNTGLG